VWGTEKRRKLGYFPGLGKFILGEPLVVFSNQCLYLSSAWSETWAKHINQACGIWNPRAARVSDKVKRIRDKKQKARLHCWADGEGLVVQAQRVTCRSTRRSHLVSGWTLRAGRERNLCCGSFLPLLSHWSSSTPFDVKSSAPLSYVTHFFQADTSCVLWPQSMSLSLPESSSSGSRDLGT
jgi:hypothetical protein